MNTCIHFLISTHMSSTCESCTSHDMLNCALDNIGRCFCTVGKLWVQLSQGVLARGGDIAATTIEVECLEIQTSSSYFQHAGIGDSVAVHEVECLEIRTSSCYFHHTGVGDVPALEEVECLEIRTSSCYFHHTGVCDSVYVAIEVE